MSEPMRWFIAVWRNCVRCRKSILCLPLDTCPTCEECSKKESEARGDE